MKILRNSTLESIQNSIHTQAHGNGIASEKASIQRDLEDYTLLVHGSSVRQTDGVPPRDLDVLLAGESLLPLHRRISFSREYSVAINQSFILDALLHNWLARYPHTRDLPMDISEYHGTQPTLLVPWGAAGRGDNYHIVNQAPGHTIVVQEVNGIGSALRGDLLEPGAFEDWKETQISDEYKLYISLGGIAMAWEDPYYGDLLWTTERLPDPMEGLGAIHKAMRTHSHGEELVRSLPEGDKLYQLIANGDRTRRYVSEHYAHFHADEAEPTPHHSATLDFGAGKLILNDVKC